MEYEKLKGKTVKLNKREVHVEKIREIEGFGPNTYEINDNYTYSTDAIFMAIIEVESAERSDEKLGFFGSLKRKFGLFVYKKTLVNFSRFGSPIGVRYYGHHKCAFFVELWLGKKAYVIEFVFRDKNLYKDGVYPKENINLKKVV